MNQFAANGRKSNTTLGLSKGRLRRLTRTLDRACALAERDACAGDALIRLASEARMLEAAATLAAEGRVRGLPGREGVADIYRLAQALLAGGERAIRREGLMDTLSGREWKQRELWAVPEALRTAIAEAGAEVAAAILRDAEAGLSADRWISRTHIVPKGRTPAFYERALRRCGEEGLSRARIEKALRESGTTPEAVVRAAHEARAHQLLRLENLSAARRFLEELDWQACFETLSEVEAELRRDPSGVYPRMDDASRQRVRDQVAVIARRAGLPEREVAEQAVRAARRAGNAENILTMPPEATCCWWLCDDGGRRALLERMGVSRTRLPRLIPDPKGHRIMAAIAMLTAAIAAVLTVWLRKPSLLPVLIPAAWTAADAVVARIFPLFVKPAALLKLKMDRLPDDWRALVVTPVLIPDAAHAAAMCDNLEALGCLEKDPNLSYLLLGDFADADQEVMPGDDAILETVRERMAAMNRRAGREKYYYLHRPRTLLKADGRWMGRDRKRGALVDLNRLLLGGESAFLTDGAALKTGFQWVLTLDADTRLLPGDAHRLIGAAVHPMNRRYAVFQPRMEAAPSACQNRFCQLFNGAGGVDTYPTAASSLWMDLTGTGVYGGKGLYRVDAFQRAVEGALPEGRILSHDLIEGALAGAAFVGDLALYDGGPATLKGWLRRQHRWTRGDWQLLPLMLDLKNPLHLDDRFRMLDNLLRSLNAPALWALATWAAWTGSGEGLAALLLLNFLSPLLNHRDRQGMLRALARVAALPSLAWQSLDAAIRALWRLYVSGRRLLDWVPSADAEAGGGRMLNIHRAAALLLLPGLRHPNAIPMVLGLFALFWTGSGWVADMAEESVETSPETLNAAQSEALRELAGATWRFFEQYADPLPPDNVQLDPPAKPVRRTSPTNIGLYLLSCVAAAHLGLIDGKTRDARVSAALDALDKVEKWRGHVMNWIDIDTLAPLKPRYVSSVDSGNLAACALACAGTMEDSALADRLRALAAGMEFAALYDERRHLFYIGVDVETGRPSGSHYDLLASEARLTSYTALMLGQIPMKHWRHLGRACAPVGRGAALLSWSGTMFEYLMPELLTRAPALSLMGQSVRAAVSAQMAHSRPWGVSESGFYAFDRDMNYQYRAFGLKSLALSGEASSSVVAPYASALALCVRPASAAENLLAMAKAGWRGAYGMLEAVDFRRRTPEGAPSPVRSHMAHHQGMLLCAVVNALTGDRLVKDFMADPRARALSLLLEERPACRAALRPRWRRASTMPRPTRIEGRSPRRGQAADIHLLCGREARAFVTPDGAAHYARGAVDATRFDLSLTDWPDAARLYGRVAGEVRGFEGSRVSYDAGSARFEGKFGPLRAAMTLSLSPEDDTLYRQLTLTNPTGAPVAAWIMDVAPVALARPEDRMAHPAFQGLFIEASPFGENGLLFRRRPRNPGEAWPVLIHTVEASAQILRETNYERVAGRDGAIDFELCGIDPTPLNPVSALQVRLTLPPGGTARLCFALRLADEPAAPSGGPERARQLGAARVHSLLNFMGISGGLYHRFDRLAALLLDSRLAGRAKEVHRKGHAVPREALWAMGLSGDRPILSLQVSGPNQVEAVRTALRACGFYRAMGHSIDLALVDEGPAGYDRPIRAMLQAQMDACALWEPARILENLSAEEKEILRRASAIALEAGEDLSAQISALLSRIAEEPEPVPFAPGLSALPPEKRFMDNGFGGFVEGGYSIDVGPGRLTPAPWCHLLASDGAGILLTERGGGFIWHDNSRSGRLTPWRGDALNEGFGLELRLYRPGTGENLSLLPGARPAMDFRVRYAPDSATYTFAASRLSGEVRFSMRGDDIQIDLTLDAGRLRGGDWQVRLSVNWLMGTDARDACRVQTWQSGGAEYAVGTMPGMGWLTPCAASVRPGENRLRFGIGWAADGNQALEAVRAFREEAFSSSAPVPILTVQTPDGALNRMMNVFLPHQVLTSRVLGRTGYYQPGGAYGFRDQLQDMLALLDADPVRVRRHLLRCAARQFQAGDALHWWHMPYLGVRTRISDDRLFLPYVTAAYVRHTGDAGVLTEMAPYLEDAPIPDGREDLFQAMQPGSDSATLHEHCLRAFEAIRTGEHGLALMGAGDWNDGMNRVGSGGRGESVWLSMFIAACADDYAEICPDAADAARLRELAARHRSAVEAHGWDGEWYRRAYNDEGIPLGSRLSGGCQIDLIAQAWAVLAGLDDARSRRAVDAAWSRLVDENLGVIRLMDPPFGPNDPDPGYIRAYPGGVRENGAQYTHGACWLLLALIRLGDGERAHRALRMLLPPYHSDSPESARRYRVEPYVMAGDVYTLPGQAGRGGWTWYTGSAAWLYGAVLALLGYERRGDEARLCALLGPWEEVSITVNFGGTAYRLVSARNVDRVTLDGSAVTGDTIRLVDDGKAHEARFPARR